MKKQWKNHEIDSCTYLDFTNHELLWFFGGGGPYFWKIIVNIYGKLVYFISNTEEVTDVKKREESSTSVSSQVPNHPPVSSQKLQLPNPIQGLNIYNHPPPSYIPNHAPPPPNLMMQMQNQSFDARISPYPSHTSNRHQSTTSTHHGRYHSTHHYHPGYQQNVSHYIMKNSCAYYVAMILFVYMQIL